MKEPVPFEVDSAAVLTDVEWMIELFAAEGAQNWVHFFEEARDLIVAEELESVARHLESGCGGMGSLTDQNVGFALGPQGRLEKRAEAVKAEYVTRLCSILDFKERVQRFLRRTGRKGI